MSTASTPINMDFQVDNAFSRVMSDLHAGSGKPDLQALAHSVVEAFASYDHIEAVSFAVNPMATPLLDAGWKRHNHHLLVGGRKYESIRWTALLETWPTIPSHSSLEWGTGSPPVESSLGVVTHPLSSGKAPCDWARIEIMANGQSAMLVTLVFVGSLASHPEWGQELLQTQQGLQMVSELWVTVTALDGGLQQLNTEKQALTRLNRLQGRFVGMASHEFKTPLTSITAYADALLGIVDDQDIPHATEFLGVIRTEAGRLLRMVNRILDFSRMEYGARLLGGTPHDLAPLVEEIIRTLQPSIVAKKLSCVLELGELIPRANVDPDLIRQVLVNLIGNAVKFTPEGGGITVTLAEAESTVEVRIADTGPGIPQHDIHRIFREFYRSRETASHQEGTGLGLTIVRHIINLHGGHVEARQRYGGGSVFTFRVPKEVHELGALPDLYTSRVQEVDARRLMGIMLQVVAEMAGAKTITLLMLDSDNTLVPVAGLGAISKGHDKTALEVPLVAGETTMGCLMMEHSTKGQKFGAGELEQIGILSLVAANALLVLEAAASGLDGLSPTDQVTKTVEALRTLLQIRRVGVPTAAVEAIHLLGALAREMDLPVSEIRDIQYAAALHDAGMARVEDEILLGETELSFDERDEVDRHVEQGVDLMSPLLPNARVAQVIRHHHERFDGSGYPDGLKGEEIPLGSRLMAVIDAWFSLTRGRSFRQGLPAEEALKEIHDNAGCQFDDQVVNAFERILTGEECLTDIPMPTGPAGLGI